MIFLDTTYLLAVVNPRDILFPRAQAWTRLLSEPLLLTEYVVWEVVNALSRSVDRRKAHEIVARVRSGSDCELVVATSELFEAGLRLHSVRTDKDWSLTDCISFILMQRRGITRGLTYDHHFEQAGFEALLRRDPHPT